MSACVNTLATLLRNQQNQNATNCNFYDVKSVGLLQLDAFCRSESKLWLTSLLNREPFRAQ
ncbi:hypothetical protein DN614_10900 [Klebsiella michiganensis]|nr:hypothetical protein [Klebsiella michiganensis]RWS88140.1 hypothetical protein DN614_10900 [Klebsiella michiganensis]RXI16569.1 hypothetical protein DOD04_22740 [Klebsiella michiganensis]